MLDAERAYIVARLAQRAHHVIFGFPDVDFLVGEAFQAFRRHKVRMQEHQDAQPLHNA
jgi:hypothetical protein